MLPQVSHQPGQLLQEEVLEHPLVHLGVRERGLVGGHPREGAASLPACPSHSVLELCPPTPTTTPDPTTPGPKQHRVPGGAGASHGQETGTATQHPAASSTGWQSSGLEHWALGQRSLWAKFLVVFWPIYPPEPEAKQEFRLVSADTMAPSVPPFWA